MNKIITKLTLFVLILYATSIAWQSLVDSGLRKSDEYGNLYKIWDRIYKGNIDADVVIMGSSRAKIEVNPQLFIDSLNKSCLNLGIDGHKFLTQYYSYFIYLQHNKAPKSVVLCLDLLSLIHTEEFFGYEQFIPYLNDTLVKKIVKPHNLFIWKDFYIPMVKFTHRKDMVLDGTYSYFKSSASVNKHTTNFNTIDNHWDTSFVRKALDKMFIDGYTAEIDSETNRLFLSFIEYCKANNIKLIFVYPPEYRDNLAVCTNRMFIQNYYKNIAKEKKVTYLDYSNLEIKNDTTYFFDSQHLNTKGVKVFNDQLIKDLRSEL